MGREVERQFPGGAFGLPAPDPEVGGEGPRRTRRRPDHPEGEGEPREGDRIPIGRVEAAAEPAQAVGGRGTGQRDTLRIIHRLEGDLGGVVEPSGGRGERRLAHQEIGGEGNLRDRRRSLVAVEIQQDVHLDRLRGVSRRIGHALHDHGEGVAVFRLEQLRLQRPDPVDRVGRHAGTEAHRPQILRQRQDAIPHRDLDARQHHGGDLGGDAHGQLAPVEALRRLDRGGDDRRNLVIHEGKIGNGGNRARGVFGADQEVADALLHALQRHGEFRSVRHRLPLEFPAHLLGLTLIRDIPGQ